MPGDRSSVLVMNDNSFCITGIESCWGSRHAGSPIKDISVQQKVQGRRDVQVHEGFLAER